MKREGFTLIELLAVIVILAIIALIATPIILNIINDARRSTNERSIDMYASAVKNAVATYQLKEGKIPTTFEDLEKYIAYEGTEVVCDEEKLNSDGSIYLASCKVGNTLVEGYTYGTEQVTQVYKPQYYAYTEFSGTVGTTAVPSSPSTEPPTGEIRYLGYDVTDGVVSTGYVCFVRNDVEYCLKGSDTEAFATNVEIIKDAYADVVDTDACSFGEASTCDADGLGAGANSFGYVAASGDDAACIVHAGGNFECNE